MEKEQDFSPEQELKAWDAWKEKCATLACPDDDKRILSHLIGGAVKKKLKTIGISDSELETRFLPHDESLTLEQALANEFDAAVLQVAEVDRPDKRYKSTDDIHARKKKNYKNVIWVALEQSNDPPLKVIHGMLLGKENDASALNDIVLDLIYSEFSSYRKIEKITSDGKRYTCHQNILISTKEGEFPDVIAPSRPAPLQEWEKVCVKEKAHSISLTDAGIILCYFARVAFTNPVLVEFVGKEHTWISDHWNKDVFPTLQRFFASGNFSRENVGLAMNYLIIYIYSRTEAESPNKRLLMLDEIKAHMAKTLESLGLYGVPR